MHVDAGMNPALASLLFRPFALPCSRPPVHAKVPIFTSTEGSRFMMATRQPGGWISYGEPLVEFPVRQA
jgi:hypothetical protein